MGLEIRKEAEAMRCACCKGYGSILVAGIAKMPCLICGGKGEVILEN